MGCRTGFYFLVKDLSDEESLNLTKEIILKISEYKGELPGSTAKECGNYKEHDMNLAIKEAKECYKIINDWKNL